MLLSFINCLVFLNLKLEQNSWFLMIVFDLAIFKGTISATATLKSQKQNLYKCQPLV